MIGLKLFTTEDTEDRRKNPSGTGLLVCVPSVLGGGDMISVQLSVVSFQQGALLKAASRQLKASRS